MPDNPVTRAELWRSHEQLEHRIDAQFARIDHRLDGLVSRGEFEVWQQNVNKRLDAFEERDRFRSRAAYTSFILPMVVAALAVILTAILVAR